LILEELAREANRAFNENRYSDSFKFYEQLVDEYNSADGYFMLGKHFKEGLGVSLDVSKAISYWKRALKLGSIDAKYALLEISQNTTDCCKA
jgi:TPR repeat protein